jgi:fido (protein-threonine AMPylation protein)
MSKLATQLFGVLGKIKSDIILSQLVTSSVAKWIYLSNKIEKIEISEGDTLKVLTQQGVHSSVDVKPVLQTYELLRNTYTDDIRARVFARNCFKDWHTVLFKDCAEYHPGEFRKCMSYSGDHIYPHHTSVDSSIHRLIRALEVTQKELDATFKEDCPRKVLFFFAYAAFAQFHFVDIHPFVDGNGRVCRFISKYILDSICPLPIPMFEDRDAYLNALKLGRTLQPDSSPSHLLELLLQSALKYYNDILDKYTDYRPVYYIIFDEDEEDIENYLPGDVSSSTMESLRTIMKEMTLGTRTQEFDGIQYEIMKQEAIVDLSSL